MLSEVEQVSESSALVFPAAPDRAAGAGPVSAGVHDEVLPRDQREGGDEEDHWSVRPDRKTASEQTDPPPLHIHIVLFINRFRVFS